MFRAAVAALALASTPALAAPAFQAQPEVAPAEARFVVRDTLWTCGEAGCAASQSNSRPAVVCAAFAKQVGVLRSFSFQGQPLPAGELDKCNARARKAAPAPTRTAARP